MNKETDLTNLETLVKTIASNVQEPIATEIDSEIIADGEVEAFGKPLKSDTYFPININLPNNQQNTTTGTTLTEEQKRKRMIIAMAALLSAVLLVVVVLAVKNR